MNDYEIASIIGQIILALIGVAAAMFGWLNRREQNSLKLRMVEIESRDKESERNDATTQSALSVAAAIAALLNPLVERGEKTNILLDKMLDRIDEKHTETQGLIAGAANEARLAHQTHLEQIEAAQKTMLTVVERRDAQHQELQASLDRLSKKHEQIEQLITDFRTEAVPAAIRGDITMLLLLATGIAADVKMLIPVPHSEPGEANAPEPEPSIESSEEKEP